MTFCFDKVSPLWCFRCIRIFTVVSEAPLRLSLLRLTPLGEDLILGGVARSGRALLCSVEHWSTECLYCKHRYNKKQLSFTFSATISFTSPWVIFKAASYHPLNHKGSKPGSRHLKHCRGFRVFPAVKKIEQCCNPFFIIEPKVFVFQQ